MEEDEEPVRSWTGEVLAANFDAVVLNFTYAGQPAQAIALAQVCYDENGQVRNLYTCESFSTGDRVYFDAVLCRGSDLPYVWKVATAWTHRKPKEMDLYDVYEDQEELIEMYGGCYIHSCLLDGDSDVPDKDLDSEIEAIEYFVGQLKKLICRGVIYNIQTDDLEELLEDAEDDVADYIRDCHNQVLDFFLFHPHIFHVTKNNMIFPCRPNKLQNYYENRLQDILDEECNEWGDESSSSYEFS